MGLLLRVVSCNRAVRGVYETTPKNKILDSCVKKGTGLMSKVAKNGGKSSLDYLDFSLLISPFRLSLIYRVFKRGVNKGGLVNHRKLNDGFN